MTTWRDSILQQFTHGLHRLWLVADPDCLLQEEQIALALRAKGFTILAYEDAISWRYVYEQQVRRSWDNGKQLEVLVSCTLESAHFDALPYDLVTGGKNVEIGLQKLFPELSYPVLQVLDRSLLDALWAARREWTNQRLGEHGSIDLVLRHAFAVHAESIDTDDKLLVVMARLHKRQQPMPSLIAERLASLLFSMGRFTEWPLVPMFTESAAFFGFLQERWPLFLDRGIPGTSAVDPESDDLRYQGPRNIPFDAPEVCVYVHDFFVEGRLQPVVRHAVPPWLHDCCHNGVIVDLQASLDARWVGLFDQVRSALPTDGKIGAWMHFAGLWAELRAMALVHRGFAGHSEYIEFEAVVDQRFREWLPQHFGNLQSITTHQVPMVHLISRQMAGTMEAVNAEKVALMVIDGMALHQWVAVRQQIRDDLPALKLEEAVSFAWVPTITSVSRQAIFAGKAPSFFSKTIHRTSDEKRLWERFWTERAYPQDAIVYQKGLGLGNASEDLDAIIHPDFTAVVGLVIDTLDQMAHGSVLGEAALQQSIVQWCETGYLAQAIRYLINQGFTIWLTSDHGNTECVGVGRLSEGSIADTRGERVRVYGSRASQMKYAHQSGVGIPWQPNGLPEDYFPLFAAGNDAFTEKGRRLVSHGGLSIEEVVVPLVRISKQ